MSLNMNLKLIRKNIYLAFIALVVVPALVGCRNNINYEIVKTTLIKSIDELPDSTFMRDAWGMQLVDNSIFFIETHSRQLIKLATDFSRNTRILNIGQGPQEVIFPGNFFIYQDTVHIRDEGIVMKSFTTDNKFVRSSNLMTTFRRGSLNFTPRGRGFFRDNVLYMSAHNEDMNTSMVRIYLGGDNHTMESFGQAFKFRTPMQTSIRNGRHLLYGGSFFYAVSDNLPIIEKYCFCCHSLLETFDYSFIPIVRRTLRTIASQRLDDNQFMPMVRDSYIYDGSIFLLVDRQEGLNAILRVNLKPEFQLERIYLMMWTL